MPCPFQWLVITDGTVNGAGLRNQVDLLSPTGFCLLEDGGWNPSITEPKGGGAWRDSSLDDGRRPTLFRDQNTIQALTLEVSSLDQDGLIRDTQELRRLLRKAREYDTSRAQNEPVWIERQAPGASETEYAQIFDWRTPNDGNPFEEPFWQKVAKAGMDDFILSLEISPYWMGNIPGESTCVETQAQQTWAYETEWPLNTTQPVAAVRALLSTRGGWLLGAETAAVWRTQTGAAAWVAAVAPPAGIIYAMADGDDAIYSIGAGGVYRSADQGNNWALQNGAITNNTPNSLIQATDGYLYAARLTILQRSNDSGVVWNTVLTASNLRCVYQSPTTGTLFTGGNGGQSGILRSTDGTTWTNVYNGLKEDFDCRGLFESDAGILFAFGALAIGTPSKLIRSIDDGLSWETITVVGAAAGAFYIGMTQKDNGEMLLLLNTNNRLYRCGDGQGLGWTQEALIALNNDSIAFFPTTELGYVGETGDIYQESDFTTVGRDDTCLDEVYIANKHNAAQLTHVYVFDVGGGTYTAQFPAGALPYDLLPAAAAAGDMLYIGIETAGTLDSGPFNNVVFDITQSFLATTWTIDWEYWDGAAPWGALILHDGTEELGQQGVCSIHFEPPSDWVVGDLNAILGGAAPAVTGYWIRANLSAIAGLLQTAQQGNRDLYTCNWAFAEVDEDDVGGDVPALLQAILRNRADEDGPAGSAPNAWGNRYVTGLRSTDRGERFVAFLNCADEQNPTGITATDGANTVDATDITAPSGRIMTHTSTGTSTWTDECTFSLSGDMARDYRGKFRALFRGQQGSGSSGAVRVRIKVVGSTGGLIQTNDFAIFLNTSDWQVLDLGEITIPPTIMKDADIGDQSDLVIQIWSSAGAISVNLYDLFLCPIDEWSGDFIDTNLLTTSSVDQGYLLDIDSITFPKSGADVWVRSNSDLIRARYQYNSADRAILQANRTQRLWWLVYRYDSVWSSEPWIAHSIQLFKVQRYYSMRGAR
jgi:hypothetical protein